MALCLTFRDSETAHAFPSANSWHQLEMTSLRELWDSLQEVFLLALEASAR